MSVFDHNSIELSLYRFIKINFENVWDYSVNYGSEKFDAKDLDQWVNIVFLDLNAGTKNVSSVRIDVITRVIDDTQYYNTETIIIDLLRGILTNADIPLYDYSDVFIPTLVSGNKILILNTNGRRTIERVARDISLLETLHGSSIFLSVRLLSDTAGGHVI